jgi:hypothetical protein
MGPRQTLLPAGCRSREKAYLEIRARQTGSEPAQPKLWQARPKPAGMAGSPERRGMASATGDGRMRTAFFSMIAIALLTAAGYTAAVRLAFIRNAAAAEGTVVELSAGGSHPQIEFITAAGEQVSYPQGGFIFGYKLGDRVPVRYLPSDPRGTASIGTVGALWFAPLLLTILGGLFAIAALLTAIG